MTDLVTRQDTDGVCTLTLNRPEALNALSPALFVQLRGYVDALATETDTVGAVILCGAGRSFCAGNDLKAIKAGGGDLPPDFQEVTVNLLAALPQPTVAAVQGHCYTGGLELALACDLLLAADNAKFADTHGKWGLTPRWGMSQRLPRRIGPLRAKEMMFTGRVVSGEEAAAIGLANRCVAADALQAEVDGLAAQMVANSWHTLRADKMLVDGGQDRGLTDGIAFEHDASPGRAPDYLERVKAFG